MNTLSEQQAFFRESARRFSDHYLAFAQAHEADFVALDGDLANLLRALVSYNRLRAWSDIVRLVQALDIFLDTRGYWTALRFWLEQIVNHNEAIDDPTTRMEILWSLAGVTSSQGDRGRAEELYQEVIHLAEQVNDRGRLGSAYYGLFTVYTNQGESDKARECLERVLALAQQTGDQTQESVARYFLQATDLSRNAAESSPQILNIVTRIAKGLGHFGKAFTSSLRAWCYLVLGKNSRARQHYLSALEHLRQEGDAQGTAFVLYQLGLIAELEDDLETALEYYRQSESIARQMYDRTGLMLLYSSIGMVYLRQQRFDLALPYLEQSVRLARNSGDQGQVAENLYWLGHAAANTGDPERAEQLFEESLAIFTQLGSSEAQKVRDVLSQLRQVMNQEHD
jgi:tetratricopeptide (TPR) repeat protein